MRSIPRRLALGLLGLLLMAPVAAYFVLRASLPQYQGEAALPGLSATVKVERDALGIATISAANALDAYRALGFVHGQERYFEMDLMRRSAAGELSELVGSATLALDRSRRMHRMRSRAQAALALAKPAERARLDAYVAGVNDGLQALGARPFPYLLLASRPVPWRAEDSVLVLYSMFFELNDSEDTREQALWKLKHALPPELYTLLTAPGTEWDAPLVGGPMPTPPLPGPEQIDLRKVDPKLFHGVARIASDIVPGSNNFAVDGSLSSNGAALVANDMHLALRVPNIWFRARIRYRADQGQDVDLAGVTLPGVPSLVSGSNHHVAWAFTNSYGDWSDLVRVHWLDPRHTRYRDASGEAEVRLEAESIAVKGAPPDSITVRETEWGPIVAEEGPDVSWALDWIGHHPDAINLELGELDHAENVDAALEIAHRAGIPPQNFVVGDSAGHIAWTIVGQIPKRAGFDPTQPADWLTPGTGWIGWVAPDDHPTLRDPDSHRLWSANNRTQQGAALELLGNSGYALGARAKQIRDNLFARDRFTPQDLMDVQLDNRSLFLQRWWELLHATLAPVSDPDLAELKRDTERFDQRASADALSYRLVRTFRTNVQTIALDALLAPARRVDPKITLPPLQQAEGVVWRLVSERPPHLLAPAFHDWNELLLAAARQVVTQLGSQPGGLAARTWGERNTAKIQHPLSRAIPGLSRLLDMPADALPGDGNMPRVLGPSFGASERFAVAPGHEEEGFFEMPGGQSGHPLSPYYGAGHEDWVAGRPSPFLPGPPQHQMTLNPSG